MQSKQQAQYTRDLLAHVTFVALCTTYYVVLSDYLEFLTNPLPMMFVFCLSLAIACFYEVSEGINRVSFSRVIAIAVVFVLALPLANHIHDLYVQAIDTLATAPDDLREQLGQEYFSAAKNKAVGVGSSLAIGLLVLRVALRKLLYGWSERLFVGREYRPEPCPACGK